MRFVGLLLGTGSILAHIITTALLPKTEDLFVRQVCKHIHIINDDLIIGVFRIAFSEWTDVDNWCVGRFDEL